MWDIDLSYREELQSTYERLEDKKNVLSKARPLPAISLQKIREALSIEWTYNSNSIEGNTLTLRETQMVLQEGVTVHGKSLREHFEAKNHDNALRLLTKLVEEKQNLTPRVILSIHELVLQNIEQDYAGRLRNAGVRITGANFVPPNARKVSVLLDELINFVHENPLKLSPVELATIFHHKFVWIHPFFDGNGRTVRLVMNLILLNAGYTPAIILANDRKKYYSVLNQANQGNYQKLALLMAQALERTLNIYLSALPDQEEDYLPIANLVREESLPYSQEYISLLARQGKIDAHKEGRSWFTTKSAILNYIETRKRQRSLDEYGN